MRYGVVKDPCENEPEALIRDFDRLGLEPTDRHIMSTLIHKFRGGPAGIQAIAAVTGEEIQTIEDVYEPYLIQLGFLARTPRGRVVTSDGYSHLGVAPPADHQNKFL